MEVPSACRHPSWFLLTLLLGLLLWARRRRAWDPRQCLTDLSGRTVIVTGANSGIGKCVALELARRNARTILACRNRERGQAAVEEIRAATGNAAVVLRELDTGSLASVRAFARAVLQEEPRLDVLVHNAGVTGTLRGAGANLRHQLPGPVPAHQLLLKASAPACVVTVSSFRHRVGTADTRFLTGQRRHHGTDTAYNSSKLMGVLFSTELARRLQGTGGPFPKGRAATGLHYAKTITMKVPPSAAQLLY
uniref:Retinol dehydrogenase 12 n=1 Tax=Strigops habroptila TaxID=2489341 RepID=A0A672TUP2_STRHB